MRLFACILLISSLLQHGVAVPHTHEGSGIHDPAEHASHPHFHLSGHSHHVGAHGAAHRATPAHAAEHAGEFGRAASCDHDQDAVYVSASSTVNAVERSTVSLPPMQGLVTMIDTLSDTRSVADCARSPGRYGDRVPIFLASTRLLV